MTLSSISARAASGRRASAAERSAVTSSRGVEAGGVGTVAAVGGAASRALRLRNPPRLTGAGAPSSLELAPDEFAPAAAAVACAASAVAMASITAGAVCRRDVVYAAGEGRHVRVVAQAAACERRREGEAVEDSSRLLGSDVGDVAVGLHDELVRGRSGVRDQVRRQQLERVAETPIDSSQSRQNRGNVCYVTQLYFPLCVELYFPLPHQLHVFAAH